jgi:hypothetical protein
VWPARRSDCHRIQQDSTLLDCREAISPDLHPIHVACLQLIWKIVQWAIKAQPGRWEAALERAERAVDATLAQHSTEGIQTPLVQSRGVAGNSRVEPFWYDGDTNGSARRLDRRCVLMFPFIGVLSQT